MARNWLRTCTLTLSGSSQKVVKGGGMTDLRICFAIEASTLQSPNMARFRVYNPSRDTLSQLEAKEFTNVTFSAGYEGNEGLVYVGDLKQHVTGHENATDSYVDLFCADGDSAYNRARVTRTLSAGYSPMDKLQVALDAMAPFGITLGTVNVDLSQPKYPRGLPMVGMSRDVIRQIALSKGATWSIQQGQVQIINVNKPLPGGAQPLNSKTGLVGWAEQTEGGIYVRSLLNPLLQPGKKVQINQASIVRAEDNNNPLTGPGSTRAINFNITGVIAPDGIYQILYMDRRGDTRSQEWYDYLMCLATSGGPLGTGASQNEQELQAGYHVGWN